MAFAVNASGTLAALVKTITNCANNGSGLIRVTATGHGFGTGSLVDISGVAGTTEANGVWTVTNIDANNFDLQGSTFTNTYVGGGLAVEEHTLKDETAPAGKTFVLYVDKNAMADGDILELRAYVKVLSTGALRVAMYQVYEHAQGPDDAVCFSLPVIGLHNVKFTLKQTDGTGRSFPWELYAQ